MPKIGGRAVLQLTGLADRLQGREVTGTDLRMRTEVHEAPFRRNLAVGRSLQRVTSEQRLIERVGKDRREVAGRVEGALQDTHRRGRINERSTAGHFVAAGESSNLGERLAQCNPRVRAAISSAGRPGRQPGCCSRSRRRCGVVRTAA